MTKMLNSVVMPCLTTPDDSITVSDMGDRETEITCHDGQHQATIRLSADDTRKLFNWLAKHLHK